MKTVIVRPSRKARAGWAKTLRRSRVAKDELGVIRNLADHFDTKEWQ